MRAILVEGCRNCHFRDHKGAFGEVACVPICRHANKEIPYTVIVERGRKHASISVPDYPDWCPLPEVEVKS